MDSTKVKIQVYLVIFSLVATLVGMAVVRWNAAVPKTTKPSTAAERLTQLENAAPKSPEISRFIESAKAKQESNEDITGDLAK